VLCMGELCLREMLLDWLQGVWGLPNILLRLAHALAACYPA